MLLASSTVDRRCATSTTVRWEVQMRASSAFCTCLSFSVSSDDVASSSSSSLGWRSRHRAIAMRWRWPPDSLWPRSPTRVRYPSAKLSMKS
mmetsp:Transcript_12161/g.31123  ORF Transcript_12161/g.31123 Transcript_12161/m.31123 type:complete len:91 (-) Transcript_12161:26-298(-)